MSTIYNPLVSNSLLTEFSGLEGAGSAANGIQGETVPTALNITPGSASLGSELSDALSGGIIPGMGGIGGAPSALGSMLGLGVPGIPSISRIVAIVLGLLLIGGGIIMFRPETVEDVRSAATAAAA